MLQLETAPAIIASKLSPPRLSAQHIPRRRLIDRLNKHRDRPLTLICAPAGSGKSTLLSDWLGTMRARSAWISLDERENDPVLFLSYVLAAMQSIYPAVSFHTRNLLRTAIPPPIESLATSLSNDLEQIESEFLLVLDDYHVITNPEIDELLFQVLRHPPRRMHLVVAARAAPSWPLATFRARGQLTELRFADLRFTLEESATFMRKALGGSLDEQIAAGLYEESEGWAVGLQLMTLIAADSDGGAPIDWHEIGQSEDIGTYLFGEVLARQPTHIQRHLLQMSMLRRFSVELCEAVCDRDGELEPAVGWGKAFLSYIEHLNLFVIPLDVRQEFARFHHLFQHFLAEQLAERCNSDEIAELHCRACTWFATHGLIEEALDHALAGGDAATAADLVARHRDDLYNREQFARLARWLRLLPREVKEHNPELLLAEARVATMNWRFTEAAIFLDRAEAELPRAPLNCQRAAIAKGEFAALRGILDLWAGNAEQLVSGLHHALELLPLSSSHLRGLAYMGITAGYWQQGDRLRAWQYLNDQLVRSSPDLPVYATLLQTQAFLYWVDGDLSNLSIAGRRLLTVSQSLDLADQIALAHYFLGLVHFARNELELAKQELELAVEARFNMRLLWWCQASGVLALTYRALGDLGRAHQTLAAARDFLLERHAIRILPNLDAFQTEVNRLQGQHADANAWATQVEPGPLTWALMALEPRLVQARVFLTLECAEEPDRTAALTAELRAYSLRVPNRRLLMEIDAIAALMDDCQGERDAALEKVRHLVAEAEPEGWLRLFVDLGEAMERLLRQLAVQRVAPHAVARILNAFPPRDAKFALSDQVGLIEPLTERELEILRLLAQRDSNREIAEQLFIAPSTVKRHTLSIYRKLDVNDRRQAAARATELGLLPVAGPYAMGVS